MFSFLLGLLTLPLQTWQNGWKPQQSRGRQCNYSKQTCLFHQAWSNLVLDRCYMVPLATVRSCCCCLAVNAEGTLRKCAGELPVLCILSQETFFNDFCLECCLPLRLQEEGDLYIWTCCRVPIHTGLMSDRSDALCNNIQKFWCLPFSVAKLLLCCCCHRGTLMILNLL